ncbi:hypothetical protein PS1_007003 [Malus domestica]
MLGVWLSRFGGRCLFDFGASNLVGSVFSNQWYCSFTLVERCSGSCKLHVSQLCQRTLAKLSVVPMSYCCVWERQPRLLQTTYGAHPSSPLLVLLPLGIP